ncbi:MAG: chloride channel protein [Gammaproteobacteria bacterium]|nr:chloride channel protein [Gammaproteobacteria bacterium]
MLNKLRERLAHAEALLPLTMVGLVSGLFTGGVIIAFRWLTETSQVTFTPLDDPESFEWLTWPYRLGLPLVGGLVIGLVFQFAAVGSRQVGVVHVMECLAYHSGRLPWRNAALQFFGGALSIFSGHSVGREGPVIHVGAASSSLLGQWLGLPNNSLRVLVACGAAASIAASFNTPIAGVIFAMEVILMEYTIAGFTPVILAAVAATTLSRVAYGAAPAFNVPLLPMTSLWELPYILFLGIVLGSLGALFIHAVRRMDDRFRHRPLWLRTTGAGAITGLCALAVPQVMGIGYDTVELTLLGEVGLGLLIAIVAAKLVATTACVSLGLPGGLIGPTLVMGAAAGGALGVVGHALVPDLSSSPGFYAMLGMGAMMGATLQAPLAALMAILELTANPNSILPGMFAIVTATLTARLVFHKNSIFITMLEARGFEYRHDPVAISLSRTGVGAVMRRRLLSAPRRGDVDALPEPQNRRPDWVLATEEGRVVGLVPGEDYLAFLDNARDDPEARQYDLLELAGVSTQFSMVRLQATLHDALERMSDTSTDVVLITRAEIAAPANVYGVLTRDQIESGVRYGV